MTDRVQYVDITKVKVKARSREDFGDMQSLIESIKEKGVLVPLIINKKNELLAGGRRYDASLRAGLRQIPVLLRDTDDKLDSLEIELIENVFRKDFTWIEKANHIKKLHDYCESKNMDWSGRKTAQLLGEPPKNVSRALVLAGAAEQIPELAKLETQSEAEKVMKRMHEEVVVGEMRRRQEENKQNKGLQDMLKIAKSGYKVEDCFKGMAEIRANSNVRFIELDPPYAINLAELKKDHKTKDYNEIAADKYKEFMTRMARETFRVAHHHAWMICWFGPTHFALVQSALRSAGWNVNDVPAIWTKESGQTLAPEYNLANCYEPFFICRKGQPTLVRRGRSNVFAFDAVPPNNKYHPTERPIELMLELMGTFCFASPTNLCMIPCLGSGVTLRACYLYGTPGFGFDLSSKYRDKFLLAVEDDTRRMG